MLTAFLRFLRAQQKCGEQVQTMQSEIAHLQRVFQQGVAMNSQTFRVQLSAEQLKSIPNKFMQNKGACESLNAGEFQMLKVSADPAVRKLWFQTYSNSCASNIDSLVQMLNIR